MHLYIGLHPFVQMLWSLMKRIMGLRPFYGFLVPKVLFLRRSVVAVLDLLSFLSDTALVARGRTRRRQEIDRLFYLEHRYHSLSVYSRWMTIRPAGPTPRGCSPLLILVFPFLSDSIIHIPQKMSTLLKKII